MVHGGFVLVEAWLHSSPSETSTNRKGRREGWLPRLPAAGEQRLAEEEVLKGAGSGRKPREERSAPPIAPAGGGAEEEGEEQQCSDWRSRWRVWGLSE